MALVYPLMGQLLVVLLVITRFGQTRRKMDSSAAINASANLRNQSEVPVLFYVLCLAAIEVGATGTAMIVLAWLFVASRAIHAAIHLTYNHIPHRFAAFFFGVSAVTLMWLVLAAHLIGA